MHKDMKSLLTSSSTVTYQYVFKLLSCILIFCKQCEWLKIQKQEAYIFHFLEIKSFCTSCKSECPCDF